MLIYYNLTYNNIHKYINTNIHIHITRLYMSNIQLKHILIIQKYIRGFLIRRLQILIPSAYYQTKNWRKNRKWYNNGKSNECEKYQIKLIEKMLTNTLIKTDDRINMETNDIINKKNPMIKDDGYEWSENFDGKILKNNNIYYFNLKFVCDAGGAQTRTLREVYHFIKYQLEYLIKFNMILKTITYFINILDGDTSYNNMNKFTFLLNKEKYKHILKYVFVGSLYDFQHNIIKFQISSNKHLTIKSKA